MMKKQKLPKKEKEIKLEPKNPADEGLDHNLRYGTAKDEEESYLNKQEGAGGRGEDNEDVTTDD